MSESISPRVKEIIRTLATMVDVDDCCYSTLTKGDFLELYGVAILKDREVDEWKFHWDTSDILLVPYYSNDGSRLGFIAWYSIELTLTNIISGESDFKVKVELTMATSRKPNQPKIFKTLDSAFNAFHEVTDKITLITEG